MKKLILPALLVAALVACGGKDKGAEKAQPEGAKVEKPAEKAGAANAKTTPPATAKPAAAPKAEAAKPEAANPSKDKAATAPGAAAAQPAAKPEAGKAAAGQWDQKATTLNIPGSANVLSAATKGAATPKVTIVEVSDFQCPFCNRVNPTIKQILAEYGDSVQFMWKNNPLGFHKRAMPAALAAYAAHKQGKFWQMHDILFTNQRKLEDGDLAGYAAQLGLDIAQFTTDMKDSKLRKQIENEQKAVVALGQGGTPAFFINGKVLSGAQPFPKFKEAIDAEIAAADALIAAGTKLEDVHVARAKANLAGKFGMYKNSLLDGKPAPRPKRPVDPTVWKAEVHGHEPIKGKADALVTIIEFSDFQCPFCSKVNPTMAKIVEKYGNDVRIVWKNNALPFHKRALPAAVAGIAAQKEGKFWEMHDKLFANQRALEDADLEKYASELGLNAANFKKALEAQTGKELVDKDMDLAQKVNARGTPNFFVNGRNLRGAVPFEDFDALIEEELAKAKKLVEAGTAKADVYNQIIANGKVFEPLDSKVNEFDLSNSPYKGAKDGDIVIVEFSDFQCPYCSRISPTMDAIAKDAELKGRVKVVFKHFPLSFHKQAKPAAVASYAAQQQGKFWEFHDKAFANMKALTADNFKKWAGELGLDIAKFDAAIASGEGEKLVTADMADGRKAGLRGTPTVYINGRKFQPAGGYSPAAIKSVVKKYFPKK